MSSANFCFSSSSFSFFSLSSLAFSRISARTLKAFLAATSSESTMEMIISSFYRPGIGREFKLACFFKSAGPLLKMSPLSMLLTTPERNMVCFFVKSFLSLKDKLLFAVKALLFPMIEMPCPLPILIQLISPVLEVSLLKI